MIGDGFIRGSHGARTGILLFDTHLMELVVLPGDGDAMIY